MVIEPFIIPSIVAGFKACRWALKKYKKKRNFENTVSPLDVALDKEQGDIERKWNKLAEVLGRKFAQGDEQARLEINDINTKHMVYIRTMIIQQLEVTPLYPPPQPTLVPQSPEVHQRNFTHSSQRAPPPLPSQGPPPPTRYPPPPPTQFPSPLPSQVPAPSLEQPPQQQPQQTPPLPRDWQLEASSSAHEAAQKVLRVLIDLSYRLGYSSPCPHRDLRTSSSSHSSLSSLSSLSAPSPTSSQLLADLIIVKNHPTPSFCAGAIILQRNPQETIKAITLPTAPTTNSTVGGGESVSNTYTCKHCFLELSSYHLSAQKWQSADWTSVARCHVLACPSFGDRRAGYVCWQCVRGQDNLQEVRTMGRGVRVRRGAVGMLEHLEHCSCGKVTLGERKVDARDGPAELNDEEAEGKFYRDETEYGLIRERGRLGGEPEERQLLHSYTDMRLDADNHIALPKSPTSVLSRQDAYRGRHEYEQGERERYENDRFNKYDAVNGTMDSRPPIQPLPMPHSVVPPRRPVPVPQPQIQTPVKPMTGQRNEQGQVPLTRVPLPK